MLNRLSTLALTDVTPYEAWFEKGKKSVIGKIKVFGCIVHMRVPSKSIQKLDDRMLCVVNLGKEPGSKAYHLYDEKDNCVYVSKDVAFEENKLWYWEGLDKGIMFQENLFCILTDPGEMQA